MTLATEIYFSICILGLIVLLINPKILKFLKRPTRWKAFGVWCIAYAILFSIWAYTFGEPEFAAHQEAQKQKAIEEWEHWRLTTAPVSSINYVPPQRKTYPAWDFFRVHPQKPKNNDIE